MKKISPVTLHLMATQIIDTKSLSALKEIMSQINYSLDTDKPLKELKEHVLFDYVFRQLNYLYKNQKLNPAKKGPKGGKIRNAYMAITEKRQDIAELAKKYDVSLHVLKQRKRFDPVPENGNIYSKTINGITYIWREPNT